MHFLLVENFRIKKSSAEVKIFKNSINYSTICCWIRSGPTVWCKKPKMRAFDIMDQWVALDFTWVSTQLLKCKLGVPCRFSLNLPLFGLGPSFKGLGTNLKLSTNKIVWIHWSLDLGLSSKVTLRDLHEAATNSCCPGSPWERSLGV